MFFDEWGEITTMGIILIVVVIGVIVLCWWYMRGSKEDYTSGLDASRKPQVQGKPFDSSKYPVEERPVLALFYANWCGHSRSMLGEWEKAKEGIQQLLPIKIVQFNDDSDGEFIQMSAVKGFPEIRYYPQFQFPNGNYNVYNGDRTSSSIAAFANTQGGVHSSKF